MDSSSYNNLLTLPVVNFVDAGEKSLIDIDSSEKIKCMLPRDG